MSGMKTTNVVSAAIIDEVLGNRLEGGIDRTVRQPFFQLATQIAASGPIKAMVEAAAAGLVVKATWPELSAVTGTRDGQRGEVGSDAGTHIDPVTSETVPNEGVYSWVEASPAWQWISANDVAVLETQVSETSGVANNAFRALSDTQTLGTKRVPAAGTALSNDGVYALAVPAAADGSLLGVTGYALASGELRIKRFTKAANIFTQVGSDFPVTIGATGPFELTLDDLGQIPVEAGDRLGFYAPGMIGYTAAPDDGVYASASASGNVSSFTDASVDAAVRVELRFTVGAPVAAAGETVKRLDQTSIFLAEAYRSISESQVIGTEGTPVSAPALSSNGIYVNAAPVAQDGFVIDIVGYALAVGDLKIKRFTKAGGDFTQVGSDYPLFISSTGLFTRSISDFGQIPVVADEYLGFYGPGMIGRTLTANDGLYASGSSGNVSSFTDAAVDTSARPEISIRVGTPVPAVDRIIAQESSLRNAIGAISALFDDLGTYSPALAFASLDGYWFDFADRRTVFTDLAGATPVAASGDLVRKVTDKSGRGYDYAVSDDARRPTYRTAGRNDKSYLAFDGGKWLEALKKDFTRDVGKLTILAVLRHSTSNGTHPVIHHSIASASNARVQVGINTAQPVGAARISDAAAATLAYGIHRPGVAVRRHDFHFEAGEIVVYTDGENGPEGHAAFGAAGRTSNANEFAAFIGAVGTDYLYGELYEIVGLLDADDDTVNRVHAYLAAKYAVEVVEPTRYEPTGPLPAAWTWFNDPRVLALSADRFLVGGVSSGGAQMAADYDFAAGTKTHHTLMRFLQQDDHNNPGFVRRSDGRLLAFYTAHNHDSYFMQVSDNPDDPTSWGDPVDISGQIRVSPADQSFSYANPIILSAEGRIYLFFRNLDATDAVWSLHMTWSDDGGTTWVPARRMLGDGRPYFKMRANGTDRIDFLVNSGHPFSTPNCSTFHFYLEAGSFYKSDGTLIGAVADLPFDQLTDLTTVYDAAAHGGERSWVWDVMPHPVSALPVAAYATFNVPTPPENQPEFHAYRRSTWNGAAWVESKICDAGGNLYPTNEGQPYYSGGVCLDPENVDIAYCSLQVDGTGAIDIDNGVHQIFRFQTADGGATWSGTQLTFGTEKCFRPFIPAGSRRVFFVQGRYDDYIFYDAVVASLPI